MLLNSIKSGVLFLSFNLSTVFGNHSWTIKKKASFCFFDEGDIKNKVLASWEMQGSQPSLT